jgi:2-polyprenyl-3-methyl-5-hydroxy-6-metoxy-1,4-benzoquinol methylase
MGNSLDDHEIRPVDLMKTCMELHDKDLLLFDQAEFSSVNCPACESDSKSTLLEKKKFHFVKCKNCSTVYVDPRPSEESVNNFYKASKFMDFWAKIFDETENIRKEKIFKPRVNEVLNLLNEFGITDFDRLIDVGSGHGWFCELIKKEKSKSEIIAIEPSPALAEKCRKIKDIIVLESTIQQYNKTENTDVIVNFEVINLLHNPRNFLKSCFKILKKDGVIILSTPNYMGLDIQILKQKSDYITPTFLNIFNINSIKILLKSIGFKKIQIKTPGLMDVKIVLNKLKSDEIKKENYPFFNMLLEQNNERLIDDFQELLQKYNMSSHMLIIAQK